MCAPWQAASLYMSVRIRLYAVINYGAARSLNCPSTSSRGSPPFAAGRVPSQIAHTPLPLAGRVIHEFDPWFNYRATEYMAANGWDKFQVRLWGGI